MGVLPKFVFPLNCDVGSQQYSPGAPAPFAGRVGGLYWSCNLVDGVSIPTHLFPNAVF